MLIFSIKTERYSSNLKMFLSALFIFNTFQVQTNHVKESGLIYVLSWTDKHTYPYGYWSHGNESLKMMNCQFQNCYLVDEVDYFQDMMDYDVILFNAVNIYDNFIDPPLPRSDNQIYIFVSLESAANYPITDERYNSFFNYTWTYKLNSDLVYPYLIIRNKTSAVVGPKKHMRWIKTGKMIPINKAIKERLEEKKYAVAWFVSNCWAINHRLEYVHGIRIALSKYNLTLDIYGACGERQCYRNKFEECLDFLERDYYFYLAFENSFSEDYVTEKLLYALDHFTVPVVFGGADYSRYKYQFI